LALIAARPLVFLQTALLAPMLTVLLLVLPIWDRAFAGPWFGLLATGVCYGLPASIAVVLSCALARGVDLQRPIRPRSLLEPATLRMLLRLSMFLFGLLLQGLLLLYLVLEYWHPADVALVGRGEQGPRFGVADTILATQFGMLGGLLLVLQIVFALFLGPLYLFRELPLYGAWRLSWIAMQRNPWLPFALGFPALLLMVAAGHPAFSVPAQVLALPLPAVLGCYLYTAWRGVFEGGDEHEAGTERQTRLRGA
jgi:hypothetical protein